jgi:Ca2+-binding RTX toxin-like protein
VATYRLTERALQLVPDIYVDLRPGAEDSAPGLIPKAVTESILRKAEDEDFSTVAIGNKLIATVSVNYSGDSYQQIYTYQDINSNNPLFVSAVVKINNINVAEWFEANLPLADFISTGGSMEFIASGNDVVYGTPNNDYLWGYAGNDVAYAGDGDDVINGMSGVDTVDGGNGLDTVIVDNNSLGRYSKNQDGTWLIDGDTVINVERVKFWDKSLALDTSGASSAGGIYRLYKATFNREPDTGGLGYWIAQADSGNKDPIRMAEDFTWSEEFQQLYGLTTQDNYGTGTNVRTLVTGFYENVLGRTPDQGGLDYYTGVIETKEKTVGRVLAEISDSQENYDATIELIATGIIFDPYTG